MLVLTRERDEEIVFELEDGREIVVQVVDIRGNKVRLGCEAARSIKVHRREVANAIQRERELNLKPMSGRQFAGTDRVVDLREPVAAGETHI